MTETYVRMDIIKHLIDEGYKSFMVNQDGCNECCGIVFKEVQSEYYCAACGEPYSEDDS